MTILGAKGFVGFALANYLDLAGERVIRLNRPQFDLTAPSTFALIPSDTDVLIHAAGHVGSEHSDEIIWKTNVEATYDLIRYLNKNVSSCRIVYISSGAVYSMQSGEVTHGSNISPESLYGLSKYLSEQIIEKTAQAESVIIRLFFPFGPGQRSPRLIPTLIHKIKNSQPIELNSSDGAPRINPIFIEDLVVQLSQIIKKPERQHYNLGGQKSLSVKEIALIIGSLLNKRPQFITHKNGKSNLMCVPDMISQRNLTFEKQIALTVEEIENS